MYITEVDEKNVSKLMYGSDLFMSDGCLSDQTTKGSRSPKRQSEPRTAYCPSFETTVTAILQKGDR